MEECTDRLFLFPFPCNFLDFEGNFCSISEAVQRCPELVQKYMGSVVPYADNKHSCLNSAGLMCMLRHPNATFSVCCETTICIFLVAIITSPFITTGGLGTSAGFLMVDKICLLTKRHITV